MRPKARTIRLIAAWTTLIFGLWALNGCFYFPHLGKEKLSPTDGPDGEIAPESLIGTAKQRRPITIGQSTADDIDSLLLSHHIAQIAKRWSNDRRHAIVSYSVVSGYFIFPLCFFEISPVHSMHYLRLDFGPDGRLESYKVFENNQDATQGISFESHLQPINQ